MKRSTYQIISSWILLICFVAGQYMVYAHQHNITASTGKVIRITQNSSHQTVSEKCALCDAMHHTAMVAASNVYFTATVVANHVFRTFEYKFTSIQLVLASGRAPPVPFYFV
ncbi:hypothetical protein [Mucilaginibacter sp.]|uniref:hypothetical protein n=1 Tax=Mucilaginibacter sp. TaxID=1882438 RepID=UPI003D0FEAB3